MNKSQLKVMWAAIILLCMCFLVPPWYNAPNKIQLGYWIILFPPDDSTGVDTMRLLLECAIVILPTAGILITMQANRKSQR
jgi:hypothetical protein